MLLSVDIVISLKFLLLAQLTLWHYFWWAFINLFKCVICIYLIMINPPIFFRYLTHINHLFFGGHHPLIKFFGFHHIFHYNIILKSLHWIRFFLSWFFICICKLQLILHLKVSWSLFGFWCRNWCRFYRDDFLLFYTPSFYLLTFFMVPRGFCAIYYLYIFARDIIWQRIFLGSNHRPLYSPCRGLISRHTIRHRSQLDLFNALLITRLQLRLRPRKYFLLPWFLNKNLICAFLMQHIAGRLRPRQSQLLNIVCFWVLTPSESFGEIYILLLGRMGSDGSNTLRVSHRRLQELTSHRPYLLLGTYPLVERCYAYFLAAAVFFDFVNIFKNGLVSQI